MFGMNIPAFKLFDSCIEFEHYAFSETNIDKILEEGGLPRVRNLAATWNRKTGN